jgi:hypothetical protein
MPSAGIPWDSRAERAWFLSRAWCFLTLYYKQQEAVKKISQVPKETPSLELNQWKTYKPLKMSSYSNDLTIIQYNVNHSSKKIQTRFLRRLDLKEQYVLAIQEP